MKEKTKATNKERKGSKVMKSKKLNITLQEIYQGYLVFENDNYLGKVYKHLDGFWTSGASFDSFKTRREAVMAFFATTA